MSVPHPNYGPCDGFGRNGKCSECDPLDFSAFMQEQDQAYQRTVGFTAAASAIAQRIAALEAELRVAAEALERVATVPVDGRGLDYYWQGRDIAREAAERARAALAEAAPPRTP